MAEQNLEITYIPYGLDEISQLDLMTNLANGVEGYLGGKRWAKKDKYRNAWLAAYLDIIGHGLIGASNDNGIWTVNHGKDAIDLNSKSNIEREMYQDAAYYIQLQMAKMTPRSKEEEKKKEKLTPFDFKGSFAQLLLNNRFGGDSSLFSDPELGWNTLDARDEKTGLRGTAKRREAMAAELESYLKTIEDGKFNFEGTSFKDENDARTKILSAIKALRETPNDESDDIPAFSALGLNYRGFFSNGGNEASTHLDANGNPYTYNQWNLYQQELAKLKAELEAEKLKLQRASRYNNYRFYSFNLSGTPLTPETQNNILNKLANGQDLDSKDISGITWAFKYALKNGGLLNLSKEELAKFNPRYSENPNRLKKLPEIEGIYYDSVANRLIRPYGRGQVVGSSLLGVINLNSPEALAKREEERILLANNRKLDDGWKTEDYLRMLAMAQDIGGAVAAWAPGYGTAASGILGGTSLATNLAADWNDDSLTGWDVAKNAGINAGLAVVGMVPGLGLASRSGKWLTNIAKWAPRLLTLLAIKDLPDSYNSLQKAINNPKELTNADWKNIAYGLSVVAGLSRGAKGYVNNRKFKPAFSESTEKQYTITTSKGKKTITLELVDKIKKLNPKDKEKYHEEVKKTLGLEKDETINTKDLEFLGKTLKSKGVKIDEEKIPSGLSPRAKAYREDLERQNAKIKENHKFLSKHLKTDYDIYKANTQRSLPELGISNRIKDIWNPLSDRNLQRRGIKVEEPAAKTTTQLTSAKITPEVRKNVLRAQKEMDQILHPTKSAKALKYNDKGEATIDFTLNGEKINVTYDRNSKNLNINGKKIKVKDEFDVRKKVLKEINDRRANSRKQARETKSLNKFNINVEELKKLKRFGWLKQGGQINPSLDTIIGDFFKNNNI